MTWKPSPESPYPSDNDILLGNAPDYFIYPRFGNNSQVDGPEDIWNGGGDYTGFPTTAAEEFQVFSSSAADAAAGTGARTVRVFYYDDNYVLFDDNRVTKSFEVTLNGTTPVNTGVTGMRILLAYVTSSGSGQTNAGTITIRWRTTTTVVFAQIPVGTGQTMLGSFTIPAGWRGWLIDYNVSMLDNNANTCKMAIKTRAFGTNTFRIVRPFTAGTATPFSRTLRGGYPLNEKQDLVIRALSVANTGADITTSYEILLQKLSVT